MLTFGSLFAGIGGFDLGFERHGMKCVWQCEQNETCNSVLERHWPGMKTIRDVHDLSANSVVRPDWLCGGFPCQDLSVAGRRAGLAGERSGLFFEFMRCVKEFTPDGVVIENVPGLLSADDRRAMGIVLGTLGQLGYGFAYRVYDAQWFGVAQRRRRVFIVGCIGDWRRAAEILFERESVPWNPAPSREAGASVAPCVARGTNACRYDGESEGFVMHTLGAEGFDASEDGTGRGTPLIAMPIKYTRGATGNGAAKNSINGMPGDPMFTLEADHQHGVYAIQERACSENLTNGPQGKGYQQDFAFTLEARHHQQAVAYRTSGNDGVREQGDKTAALNCNTDQTQQIIRQTTGVRRLTPRECERLQGFPDDWTRYGHDGKEISDIARYRMMGNAVAVPVAEWIGRRIIEASELDKAYKVKR